MHHPRRHVVRPEAGVAVAQGGIDNADFFHDHPPRSIALPSKAC